MDKLQALKRAVELDPNDEQAQLALLNARVRIEGLEAYWELLDDLQLWSKVPNILQDRAIEFLSHRLKGFKWKSTEVWSNNELAFRLPTYIHSRTGMEFNLIPGQKQPNKHHKTGLIPGFLVARWPATERHCHENLAKKPDFPVSQLSFEDMTGLCNTWGLRLPTADEWIYASRTVTSSRWFWGQSFDRRYAWVAGNAVPSQYRERAEKAKDKPKRYVGPYERQAVTLHEQAKAWNAFGLVDVIGNVWESCSNGKAYGFCYFSSDMDNRPPAWEPISAEANSSIGFRPAATLPREA